MKRKRNRSVEGKLARRMQRLEDRHRRDIIAVRHECVSAMMAQHDATVSVIARLLEEWQLPYPALTVPDVLRRSRRSKTHDS